MNMNTEPVTTTMRGIAAFIAGIAALTYAVVDVLQSFNIPITDVQQASLVALATVIVGIYSNIVGGNRLREKVTPWNDTTGAMTPAPSQPIAEPDEGTAPIG